MPKRMSGAEAKYLRILRRRAYDSQGGMCYWCKRELKLDALVDDPARVTADHLIPLHNGGRTIPGNIVAACAPCNNERHPELTPLGGGIVARAGDDAPRSPFEILRANG